MYNLTSSDANNLINEIKRYNLKPLGQFDFFAFEKKCANADLSMSFLYRIDYFKDYTPTLILAVIKGKKYTANVLDNNLPHWKYKVIPFSFYPMELTEYDLEFPCNANDVSKILQSIPDDYFDDLEQLELDSDLDYFFN